ncbi:hypothetical protein [Litoribrevibacter albus]|uniref:Uncharacterized protein n=1 Tax=Litoribrevibacter albus TaxID=1473156 RepID=A0AA37SCM4_9GAMM|nr:hypothetical protein [Litoribrevibacter albus]GLQ33570.1 hypothetical protein GCM10007876_40500 [Litoribrevibacter albus]
MDDINEIPFKSVANTLAKSFASNVIERWTHYRAKNFFLQFQHRLLKVRQDGDFEEDISKKIEQILSTEIGSEIVFDAYRRVSLAKSKDIGPRIIGILTAELCLENRTANEIEELIFSAAESLNDSEMIESLSTIEQWLNQSTRNKRKGNLAGSTYIENNELIYILEHNVIEDISYVGSQKNIDLSIDSLYDEFGSGMQKLKDLGILKTRLQQSTFSYHEDSERYIDQDGTAQITLKLVAFPLSYRRLLSLIDQASSNL